MGLKEDLEKKKKLLQEGGAGASQTRVEVGRPVVELKGSQLSVYFDAEDMDYLSHLKYKFPSVPRGKLLKYALKCMKKVEDKFKEELTESIVMGYKD